LIREWGFGFRDWGLGFWKVDLLSGNMKKYLILFLTVFFSFAILYAQPLIGISGTVNWDAKLINSRTSLDLASANVRLPAGRTQAEMLLGAGYLDMIRPCLLALQADSSSTIGDLVDRGEISLQEIDSIALRSISAAPALSSDMRSMFSTHSLSMDIISSALLRHTSPSPVARTLRPVSTAQYSGIIIIAAESLPVHGMRSSGLAVPCLFPKIWDSDMNLIYDRNMLETRNTAMVKYSAMQNIFADNPSGLSPELREIAGDRPLRVFARSVFGINYTDLIIERNDALLIISSEENRRLLSQGRVVIILDNSVLRREFSGN